MNRLNELIKSDSYQNYIKRNNDWEVNRKFCRHGFDHMLAVARITYIYLLEQNLKSSKEVVYAAGLLHDIGRWVEYESGKDHAEASSRLAEPLLVNNEFTSSEIHIILDAIAKHRSSKRNKTINLEQDQLENRNPLTQALALADDWSRDCFNCQAQQECYKYKSDWIFNY